MRITIVLSLMILMISNAVSQKPSQKKTPAKIKQAVAKKNSPVNKPKVCQEARWTGTATSEKIITYSNAAYNGKIVIHGQASFTDALPTMYREDETTNLDFKDDKGQGSHKVHSEVTDITGKKCVGDCESTGKSELHSVVINEFENTYDIEVEFPDCVGTGNCKDDGIYKPDPLDVIVSNHPLGSKAFLSGSNSQQGELIGGLGTYSTTITWHLTRTSPPWKDSYTEKRVSTLVARAQGPVTKFINRLNNDLCLQFRVAQGSRTKAVQDHLYELGRTVRNPDGYDPIKLPMGKIVTKAKGGQSNHNSGLAIDIYLVNCDGTIDIDKRVPPEVVKIAKEERFKWGGDWKKFPDYPHFEMN